MAAQLCTCVFEGNLPLLRRLIRAGAAADAGDYDKRTALHIAAAEGNTAAVRPQLETSDMPQRCAVHAVPILGQQDDFPKTVLLPAAGGPRDPTG